MPIGLLSILELQNTLATIGTVAFLGFKIYLPGVDILFNQPVCSSGGFL